MVEIKRIDVDWFRSSHLDFRDDGPVNVGAKTRQFSVFSKASRSLLGYVKWWASWRKYCFFPLFSVLDDNWMEQVVQFCREATAAHKGRIYVSAKVHKKRLNKKRRENRIKKLTKQKETVTMVLEVEVPGPENPVVEGIIREAPEVGS